MFPTLKPTPLMYSSSDLRSVRLWIQEFRAAVLHDRGSAVTTLGGRLQVAHIGPELWERVVRTLLAEKDFQAAETLLRSGLQVYPKCGALSVLLGNTLRLMGRYAESEQTLRAVLDNAPNDAVAVRSLGKV